MKKKQIDSVTDQYIDQLLGVRKVFAEPSVLEKTKLSAKQQQFLDAYNASGGLTKVALSESGTTRSELADWKSSDDEFKAALKIVEDDWIEELRKMAIVRASAKSDLLLMFLLKSLRPDVFDEDVRKQQFVGLNANPNNIPVRATLVRDVLTISGLMDKNAPLDPQHQEDPEALEEEEPYIQSQEEEPSEEESS
jgi:hypothetical protein